MDYSFLRPQGKAYSYQDIVSIDTGIYGKKLYIPFTHNEGEFFYKIELNDGPTIDISEAGLTINQEHEYFSIEKLDEQFVNDGIVKHSSVANFKYFSEYLDEVYWKSVLNILEN